jgi:hypothetical protein
MGRSSTGYYLEVTADRTVRENAFELTATNFGRSANNGLIAESKGHFDGAEYELQVKLGVDG